MKEESKGENPSELTKALASKVTSKKEDKVDVVAGRKKYGGEKRSIVIEMVGYSKPSVEFTGFWDGIGLKAASKAIEKEYRVRRHLLTKGKKETKEVGDGG